MAGKSMFGSLKLVTFDITGTLLQFRKNPVTIYSDIALEHGIMVQDPSKLSTSFRTQWNRMNLEQPHYGPSWHNWWKEFVISIFNNVESKGSSPEKLEVMTEDLIRRFGTREFWVVSPFAKELLEFLKSQSIYVGVISNFDTRLHNIISATGLSHHFDFVLASHECRISKPDPKIFQLGFAFGKMLDSTLSVDKILHVGDNKELDCIGALRVGWNAALILDSQSENTEKHSPSEITLNGKRCHVFESLESLYHQF